MSESYARWAAGLCPCCAGDLVAWDWLGQRHEPQAIGEGVMLCGRCVGNDHLDWPGFTDAMLRAIVQRNEAPLDQLAEGK